jgi:hypothetical protein
MKRNASFYFLTSFVLLFGMAFFFTGCQQDDLVLPNANPAEALSYRTSPPDVPAILAVPEGM